MFEGLQRAIDRQHVLYGNRAFVRHEPGLLPTEKPRKNEPALYVLNQTEWNALTRLERTSLYKTGRNIFTIGMNVGELREGVEESLALLHRLDEDIEVQGTTIVKRLAWC
jgi:hypothetical protein